MYKIIAFNYDGKYRGCTLYEDNEQRFQSTTGDYMDDLRNCLDRLDCHIIITPLNLEIEYDPKE